MSGYASDVRAQKPLVFLQAFADDSANHFGDRRLFMAGYLDVATNWALFSGAWHQVLRASPAIDHLKMAEAYSLTGQFCRFTETERNKKLRDLAGVVQKFSPTSFDCSISQEQYDHILRAVNPRGFNPHFLTCFAIVSAVTHYVGLRRSKIPIDFIFDAQDGVEADIQLFFEDLKKNLSKAQRKLLRSTPIFRDDRDFLPLQAADMLVWHIRRSHEQSDSHEAELNLLCGSEHFSTEIKEDLLQVWAREFREMPGLDKLQSKSQWRNNKRLMIAALNRGFIPPYGTRWKNFKFRVGRFLSRTL